MLALSELTLILTTQSQQTCNCRSQLLKLWSECIRPKFVKFAVPRMWSLVQPSGTKQRLWKKPVFCLDIRWPQSSFPGLQEWCESPIAMGRFWLELDFTRKCCKTGNKLSIQFSPKWWDQFLAPHSCYHIPYGDLEVCKLAAELRAPFFDHVFPCYILLRRFV